MAENELLKCPFCGGEKIQVCYGLDLFVSGIRCGNCGAIVQWPRIKAKKNSNKTFGELAKPYIDAWNRRADDGRE